MPTLPESPVGKNGLGGVVARSAGDASARMRSRSAEIEPLQGHPIIGGADHGPRAKQLIEAHLAMENVAADQSEAIFQILRRMNLATENRLGESRRMGIDGGDDLIRGLFALLVPAATRTEIIAEMLAEQAGDVTALGRQGGIE